LTVEAVVTDGLGHPAPAGTDGTARCVARAVDGSALSASLRQLGNRPLPWAG
jgi:hypothetical protein